MSTEGEAIKSNIETLVKEGFTVEISGVNESDGYFVFVVTVENEWGQKVAHSDYYIMLADAIAAAYSMTPESEDE